MIVKLQRPLFSNEPTPPSLVYTKNRGRQWLLDLTPEQLHELLGGSAKGYFEVTIGEDDQVVLGARVPDQPW